MKLQLIDPGYGIIMVRHLEFFFFCKEKMLNNNTILTIIFIDVRNFVIKKNQNIKKCFFFFITIGI